MSLFRDTPPTRGNVHVSIVKKWGLHWWVVDYPNNPLFNRGGVGRTFENSKNRVISAISRILRYENKQEKLWQERSSDG